MSARSLGWLAATAFAALLLAFLGQRSDDGSGSSGDAVGSLLLPELRENLNDVDSLVLTGARNEALVSLTLSDAGWTIGEHDGYPADIGKIRSALVALADARVVEEKTRDPGFYDRLGVEDIGTVEASGIAIEIGSSERAFPLVILGEEQGANQRFARRASEALSMLIDVNPNLPRSSAQWLQAELLDIESRRIQRIEIEHADGGRLSLVKSDRDQTTFDVENIPEGRELQYSTIANVTGNALRNLRLEDARSRFQSQSEPTATSRFVMFDGLIVTATSELDDETEWLSFAAEFDSDQAARFTTEPVEGSLAAAEEPADLADEAARINLRLGAWRFRIPSHLHDQMTRRIEDLLSASDD
jgi:hypothetical protein